MPVTVAHFFACKDNEKQYFPDAGKCADGAPRVERREIRAHGDHNPVHGGQFFMAEDNWHHVEGTYPSAGLFRAFFYDNFKKPLAGKNFSGSLVVLDKSDKELATITLAPSRDGNTLEATNSATAGGGSAESESDDHSTTRKHASSRSTSSSTSCRRILVRPGRLLRRRPAPRRRLRVRRHQAPNPPHLRRRAQQPHGRLQRRQRRRRPSQPRHRRQPTRRNHSILDTPLQVPPALADALDESKLPNGTPELLAELSKRAGDVEALVNEGNLSQVWLPATATKTVALVLEAHANSLPERQRVAVSDSVKRVVTSAWELDAYGDLGDRRKITEAYQRLATAVGDLKAAYGK